MKSAARQWIAKAEADFLSAQRVYRARNRPNFDAACFFAQQCIEKYLKGRIADAGLLIPKTHDLPVLLDAVLPSEPLWESARPRLEQAILTGADQRLRPILMTTLVAFFGLLPASLATGLGSDVQRPLATVIVWGLMSATLLTLFVIPVLYEIVRPAVPLRSGESAPPGGH